MTVSTEEFKAARLRLQELTTHADCLATLPSSQQGRTGAYAPSDAHDFAGYALRTALSYYEEGPAYMPDLDADEALYYEAVRDLVHIIAGYEFGGRDLLTKLCIDDSLCPIHFCDWMACFDDDDPECSQVRAIYPCSHDT